MRPHRQRGRVIGIVLVLVFVARELSGANGLLFRRSSVTGAIEAMPREGDGINLNTALHDNR